MVGVRIQAIIIRVEEEYVIDEDEYAGAEYNIEERVNK